jgi:hypothetical protein
MAGGGRVDSASANGLDSSGIYGLRQNLDVLDSRYPYCSTWAGITIVVMPPVFLGDKNVVQLSAVSIPTSESHNGVADR